LILTSYKQSDGAKELDVLSDFQIEEIQATQPIDPDLLSNKDKRKYIPAYYTALHVDSRMDLGYLCSKKKKEISELTNEALCPAKTY